jgi:ribosomal protein L29
MNIKEINLKSPAELQTLIEESRQKLEELRAKAVGGRLKNIREIRSIKKDIARALTVINRELTS